MTSRQRLLAAMQCRQPDRVPIHVRGVRVHDQAWAESRHESYRPLIDAVLAYGDLLPEWGPGPPRFLTAWSDLRVETHMMDTPDWETRCTIYHTPRGPLQWTVHASRHGMPSLTTEWGVKSLDDLERFLSIPYEPPTVDAGGYFALKDSLGERGLVRVNLSDPISYVHDLLGSELLAVWSVERREVISSLVELFEQRLADLIQQLLQAGVDGVYGFYGAEYLTPPLASPRDFREWVTRPCTRLMRLIRKQGNLVFVHCHGRLNASLEDFLDMGVNCLHPIEAPPEGDVPLAEAKRRIGHAICLEGNFQVGDLYTRTPAEVRRMVLEALEVAAPGGGYIACPSASPYTPTLPPRACDNYLTLIETVWEYGRY